MHMHALCVRTAVCVCPPSRNRQCRFAGFRLHCAIGLSPLQLWGVLVAHVKGLLQCCDRALGAAVSTAHVAQVVTGLRNVGSRPAADAWAGLSAGAQRAVLR